MTVVTRSCQKTDLGQSPTAFPQPCEAGLTCGQGQLPSECSLHAFEWKRAGRVQYQQTGTYHIEDMVLRVTPVVNESQSPQGMDDEAPSPFLVSLLALFR